MGHGSNGIGNEFGSECHPLTTKIDGCGNIFSPFSSDVIDITHGFGDMVLKVMGAFHGMFGECKNGCGSQSSKTGRGGDKVGISQRTADGME